MNTILENIELTSPCYARKTIEGSNSLWQTALCGKINIRGNSDDSQFADGIRSVTGMAIPVEPNGLEEKESTKIFWLGPNEWLLHCDLDQVEAISEQLTQQLSAVHSAITEVSDYYTVLRLHGPDAEALLRKGCPFDLHPDHFQPNSIIQTRFGHASILLHRLQDGDFWDIQVRWTYAEYLWDYLVSGLKAI